MHGLRLQIASRLVVRTGMPIQGPAERYYGSLEGQGRWSGELVFAVVSWRTALSRPRACAISVLARLVGPLRMSTTLDRQGSDFMHTTRITKAGFPVFESAERLTVGADGRTFRVTGEQRTLLFRRPYQAAGEVSETSSGATYRIPWAGTDLVQTTSITSEGIAITQETPSMRGRVLLRRERHSF